MFGGGIPNILVGLAYGIYLWSAVVFLRSAEVGAFLESQRSLRTK